MKPRTLAEAVAEVQRLRAACREHDRVATEHRQRGTTRGRWVSAVAKNDRAKLGATEHAMARLSEVRR